MKLASKIWGFFKRPRYPSRVLPERLHKTLFLELFKLNVVLVFIAGLVSGLFLTLFKIEPGENINNTLFDDYGILVSLFLGVVFAPILEEVLFRAPLGFFKKSTAFPVAYHISVLLFGFIHVYNFENFRNVIWLFPILVLPQLIMGVILGYIRVKMGLIHAILFHAAHNLLFLGIGLLGNTFNS